MNLTLREICNTFITGYKDEIIATFTVSGETLEECFRNAYQTERSLRYCSGYRIQFDSPEIQKKYEEWRTHGVTLEMFYGNGTVD